MTHQPDLATIADREQAAANAALNRHLRAIEDAEAAFESAELHAWEADQ